MVVEEPERVLAPCLGHQLQVGVALVKVNLPQLVELLILEKLVTELVLMLLHEGIILWFPVGVVKVCVFSLLDCLLLRLRRLVSHV